MKQILTIFTAVLAAITVGYFGITKHQEIKKREAATQVAIAQLQRSMSRLEKAAEEWQKMYAENAITIDELRASLRQCSAPIRDIERDEKNPQELRQRAKASADKLDAILRDL